MRLTRTRLLVAGAVATLGVVGAVAFRPKPIDVETGRAAQAPLRVTIDEEGETRVRDRYAITAPVTGRLERIPLKDGDEVRSGQIVARIAPLPLDVQTTAQAEARLAGAEALRREAEARVAQARRMVEDARRSDTRSERLIAAGAVAERDREQAALALRNAEDELNAAAARASAANAEVRAARAALLGTDVLNDATIVPVRSPVRGRLLRVPDRSERIVAAGTPILEIGDARGLEIVIDVLSTDAVAIAPGAEVDIANWGGERLLRGCVRTVGPAGFTRISALGVDEQRVNVVIDLVEPAPELGDGFRVEARIVVWEADSALTVPASAVVRDAAGWSVFVVRDGRAKRQRVEVGHRTGAAVEIREGLTSGMQVILFPSDQVADGVRVRVR
jgi:HlyD family secretion protein